jgi:hypothetical protein
MHESQIAAQVTISYPNEREIKVTPYTNSAKARWRPLYWYLALTGRAEIRVGTDDQLLEQDLAAMRALELAAKEAAFYLEQAISQRDAGEATRA